MEKRSRVVLGGCAWEIPLIRPYYGGNISGVVGQSRLGRVHVLPVDTPDLDLTLVHIVLNQHIVQVMHRLVVITCVKGGVGVHIGCVFRLNDLTTRLQDQEIM